MRIVIEVERKDGALTDADLRAACERTAKIVEVIDADESPFGSPIDNGNGVLFAYSVEDVKP